MLADEEVRAVQTELRKRHLFHGDSTGETSPALTAAIRRYQQIKGFPRTGVIDPETSASLGLGGHAVPATTPFVVDEKGYFRGANGEALLESLPARWESDERAAEFEQAPVGPKTAPTALARTGNENRSGNNTNPKRRTPARIHSSRPRKETNPFVQAFTSIDHARKLLFGDAAAKNKRRTGKRL